MEVRRLTMKELLPNVYQATTLLTPLKLISAMHIIKVEEELILIDPFTLPESETEELEALGKPTVILIAGANHARDSESYREKYGAKILAHPEAVPKLGIAVDDTFGGGETLSGGLTTIEMPGTTLGETIFRHEPDGGILLVGDSLMNLQPEQRGFLMKLAKFPVGLGVMPKWVMEDKKRAPESYRKLLDYDFDKIFVSHGEPVLSNGKGQLEKVIAGLKD
jgi:glyoxylase-like metal-dependent hydrolase (beta-lactamase superfamily II)